MLNRKQSTKGINSHIIHRALKNAFLKLTPKHQMRNPVMFTVYVVSIMTTILFIQALFIQGDESAGFIFAVNSALWLTLLFANFAVSATSHTNYSIQI